MITRQLCYFIIAVLAASCAATSQVALSNNERGSFFDGVHLNPAISAMSGAMQFTYMVNDLEPQSVFSRIGMHNKDQILSVNNRRFDPKEFSAYHLMELVKTVDRLTFEVKSAGETKLKYITVSFE